MRFRPAVLLLLPFLTTCGDDKAGAPLATVTPDAPIALPDAGAPPAAPTTWQICGSDAQKQALVAFFLAGEGDTIQFCAGQFDFTAGLALTGKRGVKVVGAGRDQTILSFKGSPTEDGISVNNVEGFDLEHLTIYDAPGNGLRIFRSEYITIRDVKIGWSDADPASPNYDETQTTWGNNGSYSFYPVLSHHILIEDSISVGSSDAGVYVGQSNDILVQRTEAFHNVAGFEFENTYRAEFVDNYAHDNVGGFLVFDLPGRAQFGEKNLVHSNRSFGNNLRSFAAHGAIVATVPTGTGMLVFASDQLELYDNDIENNYTTGLGIVNYGLADPNEPSTNYDFFPEGIHIYNNTFAYNGGAPQLPEVDRDNCSGLGIPGLPQWIPGTSDDPTCVIDNSSLLPTIIVLKNLGKSAQIVWDGAVDVPNDCNDVPVDRNGIPLTQPDPSETGRYEARTDERGRPNLDLFDPMPKCKYNKWKFDDQGKLKRPANGICIEDSNKFITGLQNQIVDDFANFNFYTNNPLDLTNLVTLSSNVKPQDCPTATPEVLAQFPPNLGTYTPGMAGSGNPTDAETAAVCGAVVPGQVNRAALLGYDCPTLDQYGLFADATDPRKDPNGGGVPFVLNTALFSDYAVKYRFLFLPPGQKATYQDHGDCDTLTIYDCYTATLTFPVGTVVAKTFAFRDGTNEEVVETRLLIKRPVADGSTRWVGFAYEWTKDANGKPIAQLKLEGDTRKVTYDYDDDDPDAVDSAGQHAHYGPGTVDAYGIPNAGACILCHGGDDREAGSPPIGLKVRNLNRSVNYANIGAMNQLTWLQTQGVVDLPGDPAGLERLPKWNVPGDSGKAAGSHDDIHARARAFLEVNCMHCHNPAGNAQNSGLFLDSFNEPMNESHGICKPPIAAGRAAMFGNYDLQPGNAGQSILPNRVASVEPGVRMPPVARTVQQKEAVDLLNTWVNTVVQEHAAAADDKCAGGSGL
jgi:parallel beta-helix repeat protein